jgi:hypothetical protein
MATIMNPSPLLLKAMLLGVLVGFVELGSWGVAAETAEIAVTEPQLFAEK